MEKLCFHRTDFHEIFVLNFFLNVKKIHISLKISRSVLLRMRNLLLSSSQNEKFVRQQLLGQYLPHSLSPYDVLASQHFILASVLWLGDFVRLPARSWLLSGVSVWLRLTVIQLFLYKLCDEECLFITKHNSSWNSERCWKNRMRVRPTSLTHSDLYVSFYSVTCTAILWLAVLEDLAVAYGDL